MIITSFGHSSFLLETSSLKIAIDPWLTHRLDRFWTRNVPITKPMTMPKVDAIIISHHHCDHLNVESLRAMNKDAVVFIPNSERMLTYSGSGMGYKAIPWLLRELGFTQIISVDPLNDITFRDARITSLPSKVFFPEQMHLVSSDGATILFGGDSILHNKTVEYFRDKRPIIDIAFIPSHSTSPASPLLERKEAVDYGLFKSRCRSAFRSHVDLFNAKLTIPSSFGWRVDATDSADHFRWVNSKIFPFTPLEAYQALVSEGRKTHLLGYGDRFLITPGRPIAVEHSENSDHNSLCDSYRSLELDETVSIPPFMPGEYGEVDFSDDPDAMIDEIMHQLIGTYYWDRANRSGRMAYVNVNSGENRNYTYEIDIVGNRYTKTIQGTTSDRHSYTSIHPSTLKSLINSDLLLANSYGLWSSNDNLLTEVFHHPRYYINNVKNSLCN